MARKKVERAVVNDDFISSLVISTPTVVNTQSTDGSDNILNFRVCLVQ